MNGISEQMALSVRGWIDTDDVALSAVLDSKRDQASAFRRTLVCICDSGPIELSGGAR